MEPVVNCKIMNHPSASSAWFSTNHAMSRPGAPPATARLFLPCAGPQSYDVERLVSYFDPRATVGGGVGGELHSGVPGGRGRRCRPGPCCPVHGPGERADPCRRESGVVFPQDAGGACGGAGLPGNRTAHHAPCFPELL